MRSIAEKYLNNVFRSPEEGTGAAAASPAASSVPAAAASTPASPAAAPSTSEASPAAGAPDTSDGTDAFDAFGTDDFEQVEITEPASEPGPDVVESAAPAAAAAPAAPAPAAPAPAPAAAEPPAAPAPQQGAPGPSDVANILQGISANEPALVNWMAQNAFKLTKEEQDAFETDAVGSIPRLMARVHVEATKNTLNLIQSIVPRLVADGVMQITGARAKATEALDQFYATNTFLNKEAHGAAVDSWAKAFRAANPKATRKEAIDYVGRAVAIQFGIPIPATSAQGAPPAPAAQRRPAPFAPARQGVRQQQTQVVEENPFAGLGEDFE